MVNQEEIFEKGLEIGRFMAGYSPATLQSILECPRDASGEFLRGLRQARKEVRVRWIEKNAGEGEISERERKKRLKELEKIQEQENEKPVSGRTDR